jgi:hypothetical protein
MARAGKSRAEICEENGWSARRITNWFSNHKGFRAVFEEAERAGNLTWSERRLDRSERFGGLFIDFRKVYLGMETTWFQQRAIDAIEATEPGEITMVLWPPEHGKTTLLEDYCTWKIVHNNGYRVTVGSETADHGIKMIGRVQNRMEPDGPCPAIHEDFGPLAPDADHHPTWTTRRFNVAMRSTDERDYNMSAIGITGRVQGTRCDLLLLDDMQDVKSIDQSQKYFDIIKQSFLSRPSMFGRTVIIGTRVGEFDVYRKLIDADIIDHLVTIPAYDVANSPVWGQPKVKPDRRDPETWAPPGVKFLWPEKYDVVDPDSIPPKRQKDFHRFAYAKLRYQVGEPTWWRVYMQKPEAATSMTFDEATTTHMLDEHRSIIGTPARANVRRVDGSGGDGHGVTSSVPVPVLVSVDPALGGGNAVLAAAAYPDRMEVLHVRLDYDLTKYDEIVQIIAEECHRYSTPDSVVTMVIVEDKAFQKGLLTTDAMIELQRRFGFRLVPNNTNNDKSSHDIGVPAMPLSMIRREITVPWADEASQTNMGLLLGQLHIWRPGTRGNTLTVKKDKVPQDLTMTLWFAWKKWRTVARDTTMHMTVNAAAFTSRGSPLRGGRRRVTIGRPRRRAYRSRSRGGWR